MSETMTPYERWWRESDLAFSIDRFLGKVRDFYYPITWRALRTRWQRLSRGWADADASDLGGYFSPRIADAIAVYQRENWEDGVCYGHPGWICAHCKATPGHYSGECPGGHECATCTCAAEWLALVEEMRLGFEARKHLDHCCKCDVWEAYVSAFVAILPKAERDALHVAVDEHDALWAERQRRGFEVCSEWWGALWI